MDATHPSKMKKLISILVIATAVLLVAIHTLTPARHAFGGNPSRPQITTCPSYYADFRSLPVPPSTIQEAQTAIRLLN